MKKLICFDIEATGVELGFAYWVLDKDFSENTKMHTRMILNERVINRDFAEHEELPEPSELF